MQTFRPRVPATVRLGSPTARHGQGEGAREIEIVLDCVGVTDIVANQSSDFAGAAGTE